MLEIDEWKQMSDEEDLKGGTYTEIERMVQRRVEESDSSRLIKGKHVSVNHCCGSPCSLNRMLRETND